MKKSAFLAALLLVVAGLSGCPLYEHDDAGCYSHSDCDSGYLCDDGSGLCYAEESDACRKPSDCGTNETCGRSGTCTTGDCHYASVGCVRGYVCDSGSGRWECVTASEATGNGGAGGESGGEGGSTTDGGAAGQAGEMSPSSGGMPAAGASAGG